MEIAAWCPCSTAQMMFFGPNAASPPKNTPARVDWKVCGSTFDTLGSDAPRGVERVFHPLEHHAPELAVLDDEMLRRAVDDDLDALLFGVLQLPRGSLEEAPRLARHHLHALGTQAQAGAAAVHGGVADADDQHPLTDLVDVAECY